MTNALDHEGTKSFKHTETDRERAEKLGIAGRGAGPEWTESMRIRRAFQDIQRKAHQAQQDLDQRELTLGQLLALLDDINDVDADYEPEK